MYKQDCYVNQTSRVHHLICTQSESSGLQVLVISGEMFIFERQLLKCYCRFNPLPRSVALCFSISSHNQFISRALHAAYHHRETDLSAHCLIVEIGRNIVADHFFEWSYTASYRETIDCPYFLFSDINNILNYIQFIAKLPKKSMAYLGE